jgi:alanine dehydrogenase
MKVAVPREIKNNEFRVAITPAGVHDLVGHGHEVLIETGAGLGSSIPDDAYVAAGASIAPDAATVWAAAELLLKVKEPIESEYGYFRSDLLLFTYLHLAAEPELTTALTTSGVTAIAYETVQLPNRALPLLAPDERGRGSPRSDRGSERDAQAQWGARPSRAWRPRNAQRPCCRARRRGWRARTPSRSQSAWEPR